MTYTKLSQLLSGQNTRGDIKYGYTLSTVCLTPRSIVSMAALMHDSNATPMVNCLVMLLSTAWSQQKFRANKQELEVMFDVEPVGTLEGTGDPPHCPPPAAEVIAKLNTAEVRVSVEDGVDGAAGDGGKSNGGGDGSQKVTPWEVEVSGVFQLIFFYLCCI